jgi:hypothetical protein
MPNTTGLIDALAFPPLGTLLPVLDTGGPYAAGDHSLTTFTTAGAGLLPAGTYQVHGTYGVIVVPNGAIPVTWGHSTGFDGGGALGNEGDVYENSFCQLVPEHQVLSGFYLPLDRVQINTVPGYMLWPFRLIGGDLLGLHVYPGVSVDLFYLCVL